MKRRTVVTLLTTALAALTSVALEFADVKDIPYYSAEELAAKGDYARAMCRLNLRYPLGVTNFATVVSIHGGGLVRGHRGNGPWPQERRGKDPVAFVAVEYRLLTNATPEECVGDAAAAVAWTLRHVSEYGGDPRKVFVSGVSGGGYLTAMIGLDPSWLAAHGYKPTDLAGIAPLTGQMATHFNVRAVSQKDDSPRFKPKFDRWAPIYHIATNPMPPAAFLTGGREYELKSRVEENALLESALRALNQPNIEFHETEGSHAGGVAPSSYFLRDFVMKTVDAGAVGRFAPNERVAFLGDSITHGGGFVSFLQLFVALRHPGWNVRCYNVGISGDSTGGALDRIGWDLKTYRPDRVFVMLGMNDIGRGYWETAEPTPLQAKGRADAIARYTRNQSDLVEKLDRLGVKRVLITPTPYDQYSKNAKAVCAVCCNDPGLATCATIVRELAARHSLGLVDLHAPLTETLRANPELLLCGNDRVHPVPVGHLLMTAHILEAMGESPLVARVSINAETGTADALGDPGSRNVVLTAVSGDPTNGVAFTYAPKALPLPVTKKYRDAERLYPLTERFNHEDFIVRGLAAGRYSLAFDGREIGVFTADEFAAGVNVAILDTPNQRVAQATASTADGLRGCESRRRTLPQIDRLVRRQKIDPADFAAADACLDAWFAGQEKRKSPQLEYYRRVLASYRELRTQRRLIAAQCEDLIERVNVVRPLVSRVTITPVAK